MFFEYGLKLRLELLEPCYFIRLTFVSTSLQRLHLANDLSGRPLLEVLLVVPLHLLVEFGLFLLVPLQLIVGVGLRRAVEGQAVGLEFLLDPGYLIELRWHFEVHFLVGHVHLLIHLEVLVVEQLLQLPRSEVPLGVLLLKLLPAPFLVDLFHVHGHLVLEDQVADPALLHLSLGVAEGTDVGLHLLAEQLPELDQHFLRSFGVVEGSQPEPALSVLHHAVDVVDLGADVVVLDLLPDSHRFEALLASPLDVPHEVLRVHALSEGGNCENGIYCL